MAFNISSGPDLTAGASYWHQQMRELLAYCEQAKAEGEGGDFRMIRLFPKHVQVVNNRLSVLGQKGITDNELMNFILASHPDWTTRTTEAEVQADYADIKAKAAALATQIKNNQDKFSIVTSYIGEAPTETITLQNAAATVVFAKLQEIIDAL